MSSSNTFSQRYSTLITLRKRLISCLQTKYASSYLDQLDLSDLGVLADVISSSDDVELSTSEERMFEVFQRSVIEAERDFKVVKTLSTTNFSSIKLVTPRGVPANGGKKKKYILKSCRKQFAYKLRHQNSLWNERSLLSSLTSYSAYIPTLYASLQSPTSLHFIMEYIPGGDLETLLNACAEGVGIEEDWVRFWIGELVEVLGWLHERSWVHRDIKPSNILLSSSSHIFLTDFGSSAPLLQESKVPREACIVPIGTCDYIAPEILKWHEVVVSGEEADEEESEIGGYGAEVDWWSTGVMAYELLTTQTPFFHDSVNETYRMITAHKNNDISFPETTKGRISPVSRSFVNGLLKDHPRRLSYSRIKNHPFLAGVPWGSIHPVPSGTPISHPPPLEPSFSVSPSIMMSTAKKPFGFGFGSSNFDFTSFLSSPGMSVLRPRDEDADTDGSMEQKKRELIEQERDFWTGFTWYGEGFGWMDGPSQNLEAEGEEDDEDEDEVD
ncbi:kinase-like protein, partial [Atractiella rhizophila]